MTVASRCIAKGEEICHIYQGHFGDTTKEARQRILEDVFHFRCRCTACVNNFPLANEIPDTFSDMAHMMVNEEVCMSYIKEVKEKMTRFTFDVNSIKSISRFEKLLVAELDCCQAQSSQQTVINILKILDDYRESINDELKLMIEMKNIDAVLQLHCDKQKIASIFLKPPHRMFLSGRAAIVECLWVKYGSISYGTSRTGLFGTYM